MMKKYVWISVIVLGILSIPHLSFASILYSQVEMNVTSTQNGELPFGFDPAFTVQSSTTTGFQWGAFDTSSSTIAQYMSYVVESASGTLFSNAPGSFLIYAGDNGHTTIAGSHQTILDSPTEIITPSSSWNNFGSAPPWTEGGGDVVYSPAAGVDWLGTEASSTNGNSYFIPAICFTTSLIDAQQCFASSSVTVSIIEPLATTTATGTQALYQSTLQELINLLLKTVTQLEAQLTQEQTTQ